MGCDLANVFAKIKHEMARMTAEAAIDLFSFSNRKFPTPYDCLLQH
jgi:hypothetical protein